MGGLSATLEISKNTLLNSQVWIQTASHNIANADNKAYARQKAVTVTNPPYVSQEGYLGMGASIESVVQVRDGFIERRLIDTISKEAQYQTESSHLSSVESAIWDDGEQGLSDVLSSFWDAWEGLNKDSTGASQKIVVTESAKSLASTIKSIYDSMVESAQSTEKEVTNATGDVNSLLSKIADYNSAIVAAEAGGGQPANDLRDKRYQAITELAEFLPVKSTEEANGAVTLTIQDNSIDITLVSGNQAGSLQYDETAHQLTYTDYEASTYNHDSLSGGSIEGLLNVYESTGTSHDMDFVLANPNDSSLTYLDRLNAFAYTLINNVNSTHSLAGGSNVFDASVLGPDFNAGKISVDSSFVPDAARALSVSDLQDQTITELGDTTFSGYLGDIQQRIGIDVKNASSKADTQGALRRQLEEQQQSVSGVSIDEELVSMLQYQQIYQAAAKMIQATSEMLDTVIQMV